MSRGSGRRRWLFAAAATAGCLAASAPAHAAVLHDQFTPTDLDYVSSQDFEPALDAFDSLGADDFVVPSGRVWRIDRVQVSGDSSGTTQPATANLFLFADAGTLPGAQMLTRTDLPRGTGLAYPDLDLPLSEMPILPAGRYWIGVQANLIFDPSSNNWWWRDRAPQFGQPAAFRQPGDGFGDGCTAFVTRSACPSYPGSGTVPDQSFRLSGDSAQANLKVLKAKAKPHGKLKLKLNAPDIGALLARSKQLKTVRETLTGIGPATFLLKPKARTRKRLKDGKRVRTKVKVSLRPTAGPALVVRAKVKLKP